MHEAYSVRVHFNPRSREGSDEIKKVSAEKVLISIHAPAKGATCKFRAI